MAENEKNLQYPSAYYEDIPKEKFAFKNEGERILDENFRTKPIGYFKDALIRLRKNKASIVAFWIIIGLILMALIGPSFNEYTYRQQLTEEDYINMPPRIQALKWISIFNGHQIVHDKKLSSLQNTDKYPEGCVIRTFNERTVRGQTVVDAEIDSYLYHGADDSVNFWFGTDKLGRDIFTRVWRGTRVSLLIAAVSVLADIFIGVIYGAIAGYYGGKVDMIMMRICEVVNAIPNLVVCTLMIMWLGAGIGTMIIAMACRNWTGTAKLIRTQFLRFRGREYVMAARTMGVPDRKLIFRHILPNSIGPLITKSMISIPGAIFTESFLSYLGIGIPAPEPSIGTMLKDAQGYLELYPTQTLFPAIVISILMIAFNLFSNGLRDAFDPTQRGVD